MDPITISHAQVYRDADGEFRWSLYANNGKHIATCDEGYVNKEWALHAAESLFPGVRIEDVTPTAAHIVGPDEIVTDPNSEQLDIGEEIP